MNAYLSKTKEMVCEILKEVPAARDYDKILCIEYLKRHSGVRLCESSSKLFEAILGVDFATFETITRVRRKIQADGHFMGSKIKERAEKAQFVKEYLKNSSFGGRNGILSGRKSSKSNNGRCEKERSDDLRMF